MTIRKRLEAALVEHGLWPDEATAVLETCVNDTELFPDMRERWNESEENYPPQLLGVLFISSKRKALE